MSYLQTAGFFLRVCIWFIAIVKIVETVQYFRWTFAKGSDYRNALLECLSQGQKRTPLTVRQLDDLDQAYGVPWPILWQLHRRFGVSAERKRRFLRILLSINRGVGRWIHRQPFLVLAISFILILSPDIRFAPLEIVLLLLPMFSALANTLSARAVLGFADNFRRDFTMDPTTLYEVRWSRESFVAKFVFGIGIFLGTAIVGFGAIYYAIYNMVPNSFSGLLADGTPPLIQLMYFSVITMATVGYGDIQPKIGLVQVLASLEVIFGMGVLVFLVFALSNTFTLDDHER